MSKQLHDVLKRLKEISELEKIWQKTVVKSPSPLEIYRVPALTTRILLRNRDRNAAMGRLAPIEETVTEQDTHRVLAAAEVQDGICLKIDEQCLFS